MFGWALTALSNAASSAASPVYLGYFGYKLYKKKREREKKEWIEYGVKKGVRIGNNKTAKKLADMLEESDANKVATFALGICVSNLDGIDEEELEVIKKKLGDPNSNLISPPLRKKYMAIYEECPDFEAVKAKYLKRIKKEFLKELNGYVHEIIISDKVVSGTEKDFLENEWYPYLESRKIEFERLEFVIRKTTKKSKASQKAGAETAETKKSAEEKKESNPAAKTAKPKTVRKASKPKSETAEPKKTARVTKPKAAATKDAAKKAPAKKQVAKETKSNTTTAKPKTATKAAKTTVVTEIANIIGGKTAKAKAPAKTAKPKRVARK